MFNKKIATILLSVFMTISTLAFSEIAVNAAVSNGWHLNGSTWNYYVNGSKTTNWICWNGKWYFFNSNGDMTTNQWITWSGKQYYLNSGGDMAASTTIDGWVVGADGAWNGQPKVTKSTKKGYVYNPELQIDLKVRSTPDLNGTILGYLYNYDKVEILDTTVDSSNTAWDRITYNNSSAYVSHAYIQVYDSPPDNVVNIAKNITTQFEVGTSNQIAGNFDGEGLSLGYIQWCIGQRTLQPLLNRMDREYNSEMKAIFGTNYDVVHKMILDTYENQLKWAYSINNSSNNITEPWYSQFVSLCNNQHFKEIEDDAVAFTVKQSMLICDKYNLKTTRGFALAFDIVTQMGSINLEASKIIDAALAQNPNLNEKALLKVIAEAVAGTSQDIGSRKTAIVNGQGTVHGSMLYLDTNYGLSDNCWR